MRPWLLTLALAGCADPTPAAPPPAPVIEPRRVDEPQEPLVEPPSLTDADLDAMDEPALEAACFAGSSAACDRLGH